MNNSHSLLWQSYSMLHNEKITFKLMKILLYRGVNSLVSFIGHVFVYCK